jgi:hypothetical protein
MTQADEARKAIKDNPGFFRAVILRASQRLAGKGFTEAEAREAVKEAMIEEIEFEAEMAAGQTPRAKKARDVLCHNIWTEIRIREALTARSMITHHH